MQAIQLPVTQVGLEQSIQAAMKRASGSAQINLGTNSRQINALSQPLGRITGQADEFSKSMAAANARVLAFGASAGIIAGVSKAMSGLVTSTIKVEKSLVEINAVLNKSGSELDKFGQQIFNTAKNTGKSFEEVASGALELARQGLSAEDTINRLNDALILSRLSGLDAAQSVEGLTAAFNSFKKSGITTAEILNKVVAVSQKYAVSERDIIEGVKRSASVAQQAGVSFEELAAVITAVQQTTARGGAVIGNSFKTIFARIQRKDVLSDLKGMGIAVEDLQGNVLPALRILENLAAKLNNFSQIEQASIAEKLGGVFQLDKLLAALKDLSSEASVTSGALEVMGKAGNSAYQKNVVLNQTLAALLNKVAVSAEQLGAKLGEIGVTDSLKNVLGFFNGLLEGIQKVLGEESGLGTMVRGLVKGLGNFLGGPGLAIFGAIILKLSKDLVQFGFASLKTFFGIGKAAQEVKSVETAISQILAKNVNLQQQLFALEGNRAAQLKVITGALVEQEALLRRSANISSGLAKPLYNVGVRAGGSGLRVGNSADGYMPAVAKESKAIKQGVGGARAGDKPVVIPNFNFGGGKKGTMVAHTGEYVVPNFNGSGGSAVFNRQMVQSMGLPSGAKKINAAGGFVPNFAIKGLAAKDFDKEGGGEYKILAGRIFESLLRGENYIDLTENVVGPDIDKGKFKIKEAKISGKAAWRDPNFGTGKPKGSNLILPKTATDDFDKKLILEKGADIFRSQITHQKLFGIARKIIARESVKPVTNLSRIELASNGFIPNFAPKFNAETVRKYADEIEKYKHPTKDFYEFPDGTGGYGSQIKNVLSRQQSKAVANKIIKEKKIEDKGFYNLNADELGGILLVSPRFGKSQGSLDTSMQIGEIPYFNQDKSPPIDKNKYIKLAGIKTSNTPSGRDLKSLRADVNELFSDGIVKLAYRLYGETFDPASGGEFSAKLQSLDASKKEQLLPPAAQGDLFEAAGKVALNSFANLESLFGSGEQNRPFDFQNPEALRKVFGVNAKRGEAKRGGEKNFSSSKQVQGIIKKIFNDSEYGQSAVQSLKNQGAFNFSKAQKAAQAKNAFGGFIPNFAQTGQLIGSGQESDVFRKGNRVIKYSKGDERQASEKAQLNKAMNWAAAKNQLNNIYKDGKLRILQTFQRQGFSVQAFAGETGATVIKDKLKAFKLSDLIDRKFEEARNRNTQEPDWLAPLFFDPDPRNFTFLNGVKGDINRASVEEIFNANKFGLIDMGVYPLRLPDIKKRAAGGFLPNFANPLQAAVGREMAAGVPASQIYIDKSPALKNAANPMGLMVANRRDEPAGGFQGINRARREGANPMTYGAAGGFVPNYVAAVPAQHQAAAYGRPAASSTANDKAASGAGKTLVALVAFQSAVSVLSGFLEQAGDGGKKLAETLQKVATTALIFGGIAFSDPIKKLKEFADELEKTRKAARDSATDGYYKGYRSGRAGESTDKLNLMGKIGGGVGRGVTFARDTASNAYGFVRNKAAGAATAFASTNIGGKVIGFGRGVGNFGRGVGAVGGFVGRGIGAAGVAAGGLLGPITLAVGGFKAVGEALSGFRTFSNSAAKSLGEMSVYAAKASESLSELDKTAIEAETNRRYGVTGGTLLGSIADITGASAIASGITGRQISNTSYRGRNVELSNVSEDTFKQIEKAFIASYVGANRTKFATAEDAAGVAAAEFSKKFADGFDEFDAEYIKNDIKELSEEAQRFRKDNAVAEALKQAKIQSELAARDVINFNNVLGDSANKIIQLKAKVFELKSSNEIFKALSEAGTENAINLSEFQKVAQKLGTTLQSLDASKAVQELDLFTKTTENIDNIVRTNLKDLTVQDVGLGEVYSKIKTDILSGDLERINAVIANPAKASDLIRLFGQDYRTVLQDLTKEYANQTVEIKNQLKEAQNNANIEAYRSALAQQTTSALENQTKQLDLQKLSFEKMSEYADKIRASTSKISDLNFEKGLIGATQRQRLSAQISRRPELEARARKESLRNFQKDRISSVQSLESLIPSTLSSELQFSLKTGILEATKSIRKQNTLDKVAEEANKRYAETVQEINKAVKEETTERSRFIDQIQDSLTNGSIKFESSVVGAAQEFARIIKASSLAPKEVELKDLQSKKAEAQKDLESRNVAIEKYLSDRDKYIKKFEKGNPGQKSLMRDLPFENDSEYLKLTGNLDKSQQSFLDLNTAIAELEKRIKEFVPTPTFMPSSVIPPLLKRKLETPETKPLPTSPPEGTEDPLEAARLEEKASLLEIANTTENAADELQKLTSVSRILADEFMQLKDGIPAAIAAIISQRNKSISGAEILGANYDLETNRQLAGAKTQEEYEKITRDRQNKGIGQLFAEEYGKTPEEQALDLKKTIVDGSVQFKNNMIEAIMGAAEGTSSLKDGLRSAAYEFVKMINQKMMSNLVDKLVGGNVQSGTGQTSGGLINFFSNMFASGGKVTGGSGTKDDVPAMLMGGEYVVNKRAVAKYGPQFLEAINNGTLAGYAKGGTVQRGPQGNFYTPGTFGQGAISGKRNLLDFATQSGTTGKYDQMVNESGFQAIRLEPESNRLSFSGMRNSPMFEVTQSAKQQAFDLYLQQYNAEQEARRQSKAQKKALTNQLLMLAGSVALGGLGKVAMTGGKAALGSLGSNATLGQKAMAFLKGAWSGGNVAGTNQMAGGLKNLFTGNFNTAFRSGTVLKAIGLDDGLQIKSRILMPDRNSMYKNIYPIPTGDGADTEAFNMLIGERYATGGMIPSTSGIDTVPAMLSGGEFIMNRAAVQNIGAGNLRSMNSGAASVTSEETSKDLNAQLIAKLDELIQVSGSSGDININVSSSGDSREQSSTQDGSSQRQQLARQIRDAVLQVIQEEKRIGGTLRR
jgi:TP901 family phage tail tape measure protein